MIRRARLIALIQQLVRINSENPGSSEKAIALYVRDFLAQLGVRARLVEFARGRTNVLAHIPGAGTRRLLVTPHLDTVPAGTSWTVPPFKGVLRHGRLYGLGATDCKGNLACALEIIRSMREDGVRLAYELVFAATADEETGSDLGLIPLLKKGMLEVDAALVLDADDFHIVVAQKGLMHLKLRISGKKAHGAYPHLGVNAIDAAASVLQALRHFPFKKASHPYLRPPTVNAGVIRGGDKVNVVADWCETELDFRFLPGMAHKDILRSLHALCRRYARRYTITLDGVQQPYEIPVAHPLVKGLTQAMRRVRLPVRISGSEGATVITFFQDRRIPAVATGVGVAGCAHIADEYILCDALYRGTCALEHFIRNYRF
jgi:succinyl-diaminopimelate desuccinylase